MSTFFEGFNIIFVPFFWGALGIGTASFIILLAVAGVASIWMKLEDVCDPVLPLKDYHPHHSHEIDPADFPQPEKGGRDRA